MMNVKFRFTFGFVLLFLGSPLWSGNAVGNGGDSVVCVASPLNSFNGHYSLDYLLSYQTNDVYAEAVSYQDSLQRILTMLQQKAPGLAVSFSNFVSLIKNTTDYTQKRVWEEAPFGLIDLQDEQMVSLVPENCRDAEGKVKIVQTVIRQFETSSGTPANYIIYKFVPAVFTELEQRSPLQLSHLLVHEWLWDVSRNVDRNRRINRFLHLRSTQDLSPEDFKSQLLGMGLIIPGIPPPVFNPLICAGTAMTNERIFAKYSAELATRVPLGNLSVSSRKRILNCDSDDQLCKSEWHNRSLFDPPLIPPSWTQDAASGMPYSAALEWLTGHLPQNSTQFPVKIYRPGNYANTNPIIFSCTSTSAALNPWQCLFYDESDRRYFTDSRNSSIQWDELPVEQHPKFVGLITNDCLRVSSYHESSANNLARPHYRQAHETVIFGEIKWSQHP